jgi:hypothetical protein
MDDPVEPMSAKSGQIWGTRTEEITSTIRFAEANSRSDPRENGYARGRRHLKILGAEMMTQNWQSKNPTDAERRSTFAELPQDEQRQEFLESIAGPKGTESPEPQSELSNMEPIVSAGGEGDDAVPPEQPLDERDTKIPRPIVSVNGKDVEKPEEPEEKKRAA